MNDSASYVITCDIFEMIVLYHWY